MQVGVRVTCMHINFDGCGHSGFGDIATFKNGQISFLTMEYSPWSSKNLSIGIGSKKFMQVEVNVLCMHTNFDGCGHSGFGDIATFKNSQISFLTMEYTCSPWSSKNLSIGIGSKKFMQVEVNVLCMHTNFDGCGHSGFGDIATFKYGQISFLTMEYTCSPWSSKNLSIGIGSKKFMQVEVNVLCMHANFDGCCHSGFGDIATFKNGQIYLSDHGQ